MLPIIHSCRFSEHFKEFIIVINIENSDNYLETKFSQCITIFASDLFKTVILLTEDIENKRDLIVWKADIEVQVQTEYNPLRVSIS